MAQNKLGFGCMRLPLKDAKDQKSIDMEMMKRMVDTFLDRGFTYFDTAYMYHDNMSEIAVREALVKRHPRDSFTLATKMPTMLISSEEDQTRVFDEQLEKCGVDYFDYYLVHNVCASFYPMAKKLDTFGFLKKKKAEGKIRNLGFSFHDNADLLDEVLTEHPDVDFVQLQINYLDWENEGIQSRKCYEVARKHNKKIVVMEPVKGGMLANVGENAEALFRKSKPDMSPASWAVRFAAGLDGVDVVLSGMSNYDQLLDNTGYMQNFTKFSETELNTIKEVTKIINSSIAIPCTACRYCVKTCPKKIDIPTYFNLYNTELQERSRFFSLPNLYYQNSIKTNGKASDCIGCGQCEKNCPQHLKIIDLLKDVAAEFEKS